MNKLLTGIFFVVYLLVARLSHAETRKVVAIVDTGMPPIAEIGKYLCNMTQYDLTGDGIDDHHGHGTNVAGIIASKLNTKTHCILIIKWWDTEQTSGKRGYPYLVSMVKAYVAVLDTIRPAVVNLSLAGNSYISYEGNVLRGLIITGSIVSVAAGNEGADLDKSCDSYPACYKINSPNYHVVGARSRFTGSVEAYSNRGVVVTNYEAGYACGFGKCTVGTSQATAVLTSKLISGKVK